MIVAAPGSPPPTHPTLMDVGNSSNLALAPSPHPSSPFLFPRVADVLGRGARAGQGLTASTGQNRAAAGLSSVYAKTAFSSDIGSGLIRDRNRRSFVALKGYPDDECPCEGSFPLAKGDQHSAETQLPE